ncbi:hypothetical protein BJ741DRAFT_649432 [Chytriomyces cf. hyalinus JEL632]|nr:hypothetical protein BJ741DRAFT_649432 [Chytriomyces cf. hyalinus JEL632]
MTTPEEPTRRLVAIAIDESKYAEAAVRWAMESFLRPDDLVVLLNVQHSAFPLLDSEERYRQFAGEIEGKCTETSHALLKKYTDLLNAKNFATKAMAVKGNAKQEIVREVEALKADCLIVGSRGMNAVSRAFLGSVSQYAAHHCDCPVVIHKATAEELEKIQ